MLKILFLTFFLTVSPALVLGQTESEGPWSNDVVVEVALELITALPYATLITLDASGHPQARTMEAFQPDEDLVVWMATNRNSAKVDEIRNDARATLHYQVPNGLGYVVLTGQSVLVDDEDAKAKWWKDSWEEFYPDRSLYLLIKFIPSHLEVVSYEHEMIGHEGTWQAPKADL